MIFWKLFLPWAPRQMATSIQTANKSIHTTPSMSAHKWIHVHKIKHVIKRSNFIWITIFSNKDGPYHVRRFVFSNILNVMKLFSGSHWLTTCDPMAIYDPIYFVKNLCAILYSWIIGNKSQFFWGKKIYVQNNFWGKEIMF